jgi:hypothetical protein
MKTAFRLLAILLLFFFNPLKAQQLESRNPLPAWVSMIDNPEVNYFEAVKAFDLYWSDKQRPEEEFEEKDATGKEEKEREKSEAMRAQMTIEQREEYNLMKYHYKRFENWAREVKPFVQEDGRILSVQERIDIWHKQQEEISRQKK